MSKEADVFRRPSVLIESPAKCITHTDVLPSPLVSNHNTPCVMSQSMRMSSVSLQDTRVIRYKKQFSEAAFRENFTQLPFEVVYALEGHEPLKCAGDNTTCAEAEWSEHLNAAEDMQVLS